MMKDQFLYNLRRQPAREYSRNVYRDIAALAGDKPLSEQAAPGVLQGTARHAPRKRVLAFAALAALLLVALTSIASPGVRAIVEDIVRRIGGQTIRETVLYPLTDETPLLEPSQQLTLEEARQIVAFEFALPTSLPERYVRLEEVIVTPGFKSVMVQWRGTETRGDGLTLRVSPAQRDVEYVVGPGSLEEIEINGREAVFITGGWLANTRDWDPNISREVRWMQDGLAYQLSTGGAFTCPDEADNRCPLGKEDLVRIAASIE